MEREYKGNWLFQLENEIFRQVAAIPMGSNPTSCFKSFSLFLCRKMGKENRRGKQFANTFRYIDDLAMLNDDGEFEGSLRETYPPELEFKN